MQGCREDTDEDFEKTFDYVQWLNNNETLFSCELTEEASQMLDQKCERRCIENKRVRNEDLDASENDFFATFDNDVVARGNEPVCFGDVEEKKSLFVDKGEIKSANCENNDANACARNLKELDRKGAIKNNAGASQSEDRDRKNVREEKSRKDRLMVPGDAAVVKGDKCRQSEVRFFSDSVEKKYHLRTRAR